MTEKEIILKQRKLEDKYDKLVKLCTAVKQDSYELFRELGVDKSMKTKIRTQVDYTLYNVKEDEKLFKGVVRAYKNSLQ